MKRRLEGEAPLPRAPTCSQHPRGLSLPTRGPRPCRLPHLQEEDPLKRARGRCPRGNMPNTPPPGQSTQPAPDSQTRAHVLLADTSFIQEMHLPTGSSSCRDSMTRSTLAEHPGGERRGRPLPPLSGRHEASPRAPAFLAEEGEPSDTVAPHPRRAGASDSGVGARAQLSRVLCIYSL